jgi:glycerol kinase
MLSAPYARTNSITSRDVETEIALINLQLLDAVSSGHVAITVSNASNTTVLTSTVTGTPLTINSNSYLVWQGLRTDDVITLQMGQVIDYYSKLGYSINRRSLDGIHLSWQINW